MAKFSGLEVPPPGPGLTTVTTPGADVEIASAATCAVIRPLLITVVCKLTEFHSTVELAMKSEPTTLRVNAGSPGLALFGEIVVMVGTGFGVGGGTLGGAVADVPEPPPQPARPHKAYRPAER